jgi:hypothetical protein
MHPSQWSLHPEILFCPEIVHLKKRTKKIDFASMPCCSPKLVCLWEPRSFSLNIHNVPYFCHKLSVRGEVISLYSISAIVFTTPPQFTVVCSWGLAATLILFWVLVFIVHRLWLFIVLRLFYSPQTHVPHTLHFYSPMDCALDTCHLMVLQAPIVVRRIFLWSLAGNSFVYSLVDSYDGPQTIFGGLSLETLLFIVSWTLMMVCRLFLVVSCRRLFCL